MYVALHCCMVFTNLAASARIPLDPFHPGRRLPAALAGSASGDTCAAGATCPSPCALPPADSESYIYFESSTDVELPRQARGKLVDVPPSKVVADVARARIALDPFTPFSPARRLPAAPGNSERLRVRRRRHPSPPDSNAFPAAWHIA